MTATVLETTWPAPTAQLAEPHLARGAGCRIEVVLEIPDGCHVQAHDPGEPFLIPTTLVLDEPVGLRVGPVSYPAGRPYSMEWTPVVLNVYRGRLVLEVPVVVDHQVGDGSLLVTGVLRYQGCTPALCLPPVEVPLRVEVPVIR
jgi:thiol:disulfide interchange protein DsbD